jgi:transcriptional regulator with AAA-type ATPase domain
MNIKTQLQVYLYRAKDRITAEASTLTVTAPTLVRAIPKVILEDTTTNVKSEYLNAAQAAKVLGISPTTVRERCKKEVIINNIKFFYSYE